MRTKIPEAKRDGASLAQNLQEQEGFNSPQEMVDGRRKENSSEVKLFHALEDHMREEQKDWKEEFWKLLNEYQQRNGPISRKILDYIEEKSLDTPTFYIIPSQEATSVVQELGFDTEIKEGNFLVIFQLPKPLAQFWWKREEATEQSSIGWGQIYYSIMEKMVRAYPPLKKRKRPYLSWRRINEVGKHDPQRYFYVWEVSMAGGSS